MYLDWLIYSEEVGCRGYIGWSPKGGKAVGANEREGIVHPPALSLDLF